MIDSHLPQEKEYYWVQEQGLQMWRGRYVAFEMCHNLVEVSLWGVYWAVLTQWVQYWGEGLVLLMLRVT